MQRKLEGKQSRAHRGAAEPRAGIRAGLALTPPNPKEGGSAKRSARGLRRLPRLRPDGAAASAGRCASRAGQRSGFGRAGGAHLKDDEVGGCQLLHLAQDVAAKAAFLPGQPGLLRVVEVARVVGVACGVERRLGGGGGAAARRERPGRGAAGRGGGRYRRSPRATGPARSAARRGPRRPRSSRRSPAPRRPPAARRG